MSMRENVHRLAIRKAADGFEWSEEASYALQPSLRCGYFGNAQSKIPVEEEPFAARHNVIYDNQVDGIGHVSIQFHYIAGAEFKNFFERHLAAAKTKRSLQLDVKKQLDAGGKLRSSDGPFITFGSR